MNAKITVADASWGWASGQAELPDVVEYHREESLAFCVGRGLTVAGFVTRSERRDYINICLK